MPSLFRAAVTITGHVRRAVPGLATSVLLLVPACGSVASTPGGQDASSDTNGDDSSAHLDSGSDVVLDGAACPPQQPSGACEQTGLQCSYGCEFCSCQGGGWYCAAPGCAGGCLGGSPPQEGATCGGCCGPQVGMTCTFDCAGDAGSVSATCEAPGSWHLQSACGADTMDAGPDGDSGLTGCSPPCAADQVCAYPRPPGICPLPDSGACPAGCPGCPPGPPPVPSCQPAPAACTPATCNCLVNDACGGCGGTCTIVAGQVVLACNGC
jgi:hypothetical protein